MYTLLSQYTLVPYCHKARALKINASPLHTHIYFIYLNVVCCVGRVEIQIEISKGRCTANTDIVVSFFFCFFFLSDEGPMLETLDHTIRIGSTPTFLYFDLYFIYCCD